MPPPLHTLARAADCLGGARVWRRGLLLDVGSTFTKALLIDELGTPLSQAQAPTTIEGDVMDGARAAISKLDRGACDPIDWALASSSAAGGLRMASVGLTAALSGKAGALSALGAGAKVVAQAHGFLDDEAIERIEAARPHLVLLAGGLDGGNAQALLHNARMLSALRAPLGFIVAGNRDAAERAGALLAGGDRDVRIVANVFPRPGEICITPTREAVRELFLRHITKAKGLTELLAALRTDCEPTPLAVSRALSHLGDGARPAVLVDLGGATTDVHSFGGLPAERRNAEVPVPEVMRTVEGDIGMRWSAPGIAASMSRSGRERIERASGAEVEAATTRRHDDPAFVPTTEVERETDAALAAAAVTIAVERHAGRVVVRHRPWGDRYQVVGKDLRDTGLLVCTGGAFRHLADPVGTVRAALADIEGVRSPEDPVIEIDSGYALYAIGLTARYAPSLAGRLARGAFGARPAERQGADSRALGSRPAK